MKLSDALLKQMSPNGVGNGALPAPWVPAVALAKKGWWQLLEVWWP